MTVQTNTNVANFLGNGAATYPIGFKFNSAADLVVQKTVIATGVTTTLTLNSDYSVAGAGIEEGGSITFSQAPTSVESIKVTRVVDLLQLTDLRNQGKFYAEVHEEVFDKLVMIDQQQQTEIEDANAKSDEAVATAISANAKSDQAVEKAAQNLVDMQAQYNAFEQGASLVVIGDYAAGLVVGGYNNIFRKDGEFYRAKAETELPYALNGNWAVDALKFVSVGDAVLRQELAGENGASLVGGAAQIVKTISDLRSKLKTGASKYAETLGYYAAGDGGGGLYYLDASDTTSVDDGGSVIVAADGGRWKLNHNGQVNVLQFGAKPGDDTLATAQLNTVAFRRATLSMQSAWDAFKVGKRSRSVYVPAGDYNLSNGFTVPMGCSIFSDGLGVTRIKCLPATADATNVLPLVSLGRVIVDATLATAKSNGAYVTQPPPHIDGLYLNPQNSNIGLSIDGIAGFNVGTLWIQASTAVDIVGGSTDGIIGKIFAEDSTGYGVRLGDCQNIQIGHLYTFLCNYAVQVTGYAQNIDIGTIQANYTKNNVFDTQSGIACGRINVSNLVCNQNEQYGTFTGVVRLRSSGCDINITNFDARNYSGYAIDFNTGLGNRVTLGRLHLRQAPNNPAYTLGTTAKGVNVNNGYVDIGRVDIDGISSSPFEFKGSLAAGTLRVGGGRIGSYSTATPVVSISATVNGSVELSSITNDSGKALFNAQAVVRPIWSDIKNPFPIVSEGGRQAVKIPFVGRANSWNVTVRANPNPGGNGNYGRLRKLWVAQETGWTTAIVTNAAAVTLGNTGLTTGFTADLAIQVDVGTVGAGAQVSRVTHGDVVLSVPSSYGSVEFAFSLDA